MSARLVIVGGGPVGLALALATSQLDNVDVRVIERGQSVRELLPEPFDHRVYALSPASLQLLWEIGVELPPARIADVREMQVTGDDNASKLDFDRGQPLATIVEHAVLMQALHDQLGQAQRVRLQVGVEPVAMRRLDGNRSEVTLSNGESCAADLLVGADGNRSQIRAWSGMTSSTKDYDSDGVVANFRTEFHHGDIARQWFTQDAVLAWLPLPGQHISIVWSMNRASSSALPSGDPAAFCRAVEVAGGRALGTLALVSPVARFPLVRNIAHAWVQPGLALVGDAAHAVHPLAGQGVNLGFADVRRLSAVLRDRSTLSAIGDLAVLRRYERGAREAAWAVGEITDRLRSLYLAESPAARWIRNDGIALLNRLPRAKSRLIDYASR